MRFSKTLLLTLTVSLCASVLASCQRRTERPKGTPATNARGSLSTLHGNGVITGQVDFEGTPPKRIRVSTASDPVCAELHPGPMYLEDYAVNPDGSLPNAFVYVESGLGAGSYPVPKQPAVLTQVGCMFRPHVFGVMAGQPIEIVSKDQTTHNVDFVPRKNRGWDRSLLPGAAPLYIRFRKPEIMIPVTCNAHRWMYAYVGVTTNPFYAVTGSDGRFTIAGLPAGVYGLSVWTATFGTQEQQVVVNENQSSAVHFVFKLQ
jgi:plastocyanin